MHWPAAQLIQSLVIQYQSCPFNWRVSLRSATQEIYPVSQAGNLTWPLTFAILSRTVISHKHWCRVRVNVSFLTIIWYPSLTGWSRFDSPSCRVWQRLRQTACTATLQTNNGLERSRSRSILANFKDTLGARGGLICGAVRGTLFHRSPWPISPNSRQKKTGARRCSAPSTTPPLSLSRPAPNEEMPAKLVTFHSRPSRWSHPCSSRTTRVHESAAIERVHATEERACEPAGVAETPDL